MRWAGDRPQRLSDFGGHLLYRNSLQRTLRDQEAQPFSEFVSLLKQQTELLNPGNACRATEETFIPQMQTTIE
jgi:hypothetical protein